jgi:hypothetical protein
MRVDSRKWVLGTENGRLVAKIAIGARKSLEMGASSCKRPVLVQKRVLVVQTGNSCALVSVYCHCLRFLVPVTVCIFRRLWLSLSWCVALCAGGKSLGNAEKVLGSKRVFAGSVNTKLKLE